MPDLVFVQIGAATSTPIPAVDYDLISQTSLAQAAGLIRDAAFHLDNESGLVHIASCYGTQSCVVFGPTPLAYFGYLENINIPPATCGNCWWITETWMDRCPKGLPSPICMETAPSKIVEAILPRIREIWHIAPAGPRAVSI